MDLLPLSLRGHVLLTEPDRVIYDGKNQILDQAPELLLAALAVGKIVDRIAFVNSSGTPGAATLRAVPGPYTTSQAVVTSEPDVRGFPTIGVWSTTFIPNSVFTYDLLMLMTSDGYPFAVEGNFGTVVTTPGKPIAARWSIYFRG